MSTKMASTTTMLKTKVFNELLWPFAQLSDDYVVLDTETTGLPDEQGLPDIVTLGLVVVSNRVVVDAVEFSIRPERSITPEAEAIHGISNDQAAGFEPLANQWQNVLPYLSEQLIVIHNASFDWPVLCHHIACYHLEMPTIQGVFCSQKAATPWAQAHQLKCSQRGPSLDMLTQVLAVHSHRADHEGQHGAKVDSQQTAEVVEELRSLAKQSGPSENHELDDFLKPRILAAKKGEFSDKTVDDIFDEVNQDEINKKEK